MKRILLAALALMMTTTMVFENAEARRKRRSVKPLKTACEEGVASSTIYNLPKESKPETYKGFSSFRSAVKMQGAGLTNKGTIARYKGGDLKANSSCKTTTYSASGQCLMSYFSVAADRKRGWSFGDIIHVPDLAGTEVTLPDSGKKIKHPGYFVVHDVGGVIKGSNRFDFFVGATDATNNAFQKAGLGDKRACKFKFRKVDPDSEEGTTRLAEMERLTDSKPQASVPVRTLASSGAGAYK